ncbi:sulfotransferase domain-containing protein [Chloroflexota bacterium]
MESNSARLDKDNSLKHRLKIGRWRVRRMITAARWGTASVSGLPAVLGNAMPKSGSHLIIQVLQGLTRIGPFVNTGFPPVNRTEDNQQLSEKGILANIYQMKPGDIGYGYLNANQQYIQALDRSGMASVFVYRDPRDMIISHVFYATEMFEDHGMHRYYTEHLETMEERINAAICGVNEKGSELKSVKARYDAYQGWFNQPKVLSIRFEDLILDQERAFNQLLNYLEERCFQSGLERKKVIEELAAAIVPKRSGTFRKGKPGNWREYFTQENIDIFKESTGDLLIQLGYEDDNEW